MTFIHARTFETRWGLGLTFIDVDDETDVEMLKLQLWAPLGTDFENARICLRVGLSPEASEAAHAAMSKGNRQALVDMTASRFEDAFDIAGLGESLDAAFADAAKAGEA